MDQYEGPSPASGFSSFHYCPTSRFHFLPNGFLIEFQTNLIDLSHKFISYILEMAIDLEVVPEARNIKKTFLRGSTLHVKVMGEIV